MKAQKYLLWETCRPPSCSNLKWVTFEVLRFTPKQMARMRADLSARLKQQETRQALEPGYLK